MEHVQPEIDERPDDRAAVEDDVAFVEMPAARADHEDCEPAVVTKPVCLALRRVVGQLPADRVIEVHLTRDHVLPVRCVGVLQVG